jgi:hypothetical protein
MWAVVVVVPFVLGQYTTQVAFAVDEEPVGAFASHGPDPPLGDRVRPRSPDRRLDNSHTESDEHFIEDTRVLGVAVADEEPDVPGPLPQVHEQVPGLLGDPGSGRVGRETARVACSMKNST